MRVLFLDIETSPNLAHVWGLFNQNVSLNQLRESSYTLCFAAKWRGEKKVMFYRSDDMIEQAWRLLDEADVVTHYYGKHFDIPTLNKEFVVRGYRPPSPYKQVDLCAVVKKCFRFPSNKLAYVSEALGLDGKVKHEGHELWVKVMAGDAKAWKEMETYNKRDVTLLEELEAVLLPWISNYPSSRLYDGTITTCPTCMIGSLQRRGFAYTATGKYQRYVCLDCGSWTRDTKRIEGVDLVGVV